MVDFDSLYSDEEIVELDQDGLRTALENLPCCTTNEEETDLGDSLNLGNPGSGQYQNSIDALEAVGHNLKKDIYAEKVKASEAPRLLQDNRIDAFFCTMGHPNETLQNATSGELKFIDRKGSIHDGHAAMEEADKGCK